MGRIVRAGAIGSNAVEPLALADRLRAWRDVDSRRTRGHAGRVIRRDPHASRDPRPDGCASWSERDLLSHRRSDWRVALRLRNGSARPKEAVLHHRRSLSDGHGVYGILLELRQLRIFSRADR